MPKKPTLTLTVAAARDLLVKAGLRRTTCRVAVLQFLTTADGPKNHAEVAEALSPQGYDKSTVYRCLVEMVSAGLVRRFELGDHVWRFALQDGEHGESFEHPHFVCVDCGSVSCLPDTRIKLSSKSRRDPVQSSAVEVSNLTDVVLHGHCDDCRKV